MSAAIAIEEHPILFSGPMVRAILEGRKTQTRRVIKPQPVEVVQGRDPGPPYGDEEPFIIVDGQKSMPEEFIIRCSPYGSWGDRLWVRETFWPRPERSPRDMREGADTWPKVVYDADEDEAGREQWREMGWKRKPTIFMPRNLARVILGITDVRVERLQDISDADIVAEGITLPGHILYPQINRQTKLRQQWAWGWDKINGKGKRNRCDWDSNPWVWVIEFKRLPS